MTTELRQIIGTVKTLRGKPWGNAKIEFELLSDPAYGAETLWARGKRTWRALPTGELPDNVYLATPPTEAWQYRMTIENNRPIAFWLGRGDGSELTLDELFDLAGIPGTEPGPITLRTNEIVPVTGETVLVNDRFRVTGDAVQELVDEE